MRADARRNYEQLLEQARQAFAESGTDASLDEIARRAGVASGTLYRHFPTRLDLIEAVLSSQLEELAELGQGLLAADDEYGALETWLRATLTHGLTYRGLSAALMAAAVDQDDNAVRNWHTQLIAVGADLLRRAQSAGAVVTTVEPVDVLKLVSAIAWASQDGPDSAAQAERLFAVVMSGLRPSGAG
ncbi:TetR/AcrR family transcriptional regulator [Kribbella sp. NPDC055071]